MGRVTFYIALGTGLLVSILWLFPIFRIVEGPLYDFSTRTIQKDKSSSRIAVILLKNSDLNKNQSVLSPIWGKLVKKLSLDMKTNHKVLVFDYFYPFGIKKWKGANSFKKAIQKFHGTIVFSALAWSSGEKREKNTLVSPSLFFAEKHPVGVANIPLARDGKAEYVHWDYRQTVSRIANLIGTPAFIEKISSPGQPPKYKIHWAPLGVLPYLLSIHKYGAIDPDKVIPKGEATKKNGARGISLRYPFIDRSHGYLGDFFQTYTVTEILTNHLTPDQSRLELPPDEGLKKAQFVFIGDARTIRQQQIATPAGVAPSILVDATVLWDLLHHQFVRSIPELVQISAIMFLAFVPLGFSYWRERLKKRAPYASVGKEGTRSLGATPREVYFYSGYFLFLIIFVLFDFFLIRYDLGYNLALVFPVSASLFSFTGIEVYRSFTSEKEVSRTVELLSRYLSPELAEGYRKNPIDLGLNGRTDEVTILFCDIRGFTSIAESSSPAQVLQYIKDYYNTVGHIIIEKGGFLAKFVGDEIMGIFSEPYPRPDDSDRAVEAALEILKTVEGKWKVGVGLNTGKVVWGELGFQKKEELTVIGDAVNVASRLQELTKVYQVPLILSDSTYQAMNRTKEAYLFSNLGEADVRGKKEKIVIWSVSNSPGVRV